MPRTKRAPGKHARASQSAAASLAKVRALAFDMEEPLNEAIDYMHALRLIGDGLAASDDADGGAILVVAWATLHRLELLKGKWRGIGRAAREPEQT